MSMPTKKKPIIKILSDADRNQGHGVRSIYHFFVNDVIPSLKKSFQFTFDPKADADINHVWTINPSYLLQTSKFNHPKTINVIHAHFYQFTNDLNPLLVPILNRYLKFFYRRFDEVITVNPEISSHLVNNCQISEQKITYIPNFAPDRYYQTFSAEQKKQIHQK